MKFSKLLSAVLLTTFIFAGCGEESAQNPQPAVEKKVDQEHFAVITDSANRTITFDKKPERIVVTSASFIEPLHAVGGEIVGRPDSRTIMPAYAKDLPSVGQVYDIDLEKVIECEPDLVIINKGMNEKLIDPLADNKIQTLVLDMKSYDDVKNEIETFAKITGDEVSGKILIDDMDKEIQSVVEKVPKENKRVAILHSTAQGLSVQLEGSIAGNIVKMFGWTNVADGMTPLENNPDAAPYSMETLAEQNPEIIFITSMGKIDEIKQDMQEEFEDNQAWQSIPAVANNQIYYLPQDLFLLSPGIHYPEAVKTMAGLIYPNEFK